MVGGYVHGVHPEDVVKAGGIGAATPCLQDDLSVQCAQKEACVARRGEDQRTWEPDELAQAYSVPISLVRSLLPKERYARQRCIRTSAIVQGPHVPSLCVVLVLLAQLLEPARALIHPITDHDEVALIRRVKGSILQPGFVDE
jgi:hypothetical protein